MVRALGRNKNLRVFPCENPITSAKMIKDGTHLRTFKENMDGE